MPPPTPTAQARYSEFFAAIPAAAGIVVTATDSWQPRAGYTVRTLWTDMNGLGQMAALFQTAIVERLGKRMVFRLWVLGRTVDWPALLNATTPDTGFSVKQCAGDFLLDFGINPLLNSSAPSQRPFMVLVDAFRQYNGWTSGVCYMGSQWAPRLLIGWQNGVQAVNAWGSWSPGCTWPDSGPQLGNWTTADGYRSWLGWWNSYRLFNGTATNGGFSLGGQANAYLIGRLAANVSDSPDAIARDFGALYYGQANADAVAALLNASFTAWLQMSYPLAIGDFTLMWTLMPRPTQALWASVASRVTIAELQAAQNTSALAVATMQAAVASLVPSAIPPTTPGGVAAVQRAVGVTGSYLQAYFTWREAGIRNATLGSAPTSQACTQQATALAALGPALAAFSTAYPIESAQWGVGSLDPSLWIAPTFLTPTTLRSMADWANAWKAEFQAVCK